MAACSVRRSEHFSYAAHTAVKLHHAAGYKKKQVFMHFTLQVQLLNSSCRLYSLYLIKHQKNIDMKESSGNLSLCPWY